MLEVGDLGMNDCYINQEPKKYFILILISVLVLDTVTAESLNLGGPVKTSGF
jgi:hypothetical protein